METLADMVDRPEDGVRPSSRSVLMVLYFYPPLGGISMSRNARNVQYLPQHGWIPVVLTPRNGAYHLKDPGSVDLIPQGTRVIRTTSLEAGHVRPVIVRTLEALRYRAGRSAGRAGRRLPDQLSAAAPSANASSPSRGMLERLRRLVFFPDDQVGWLPFALVGAVRVHRATQFDAIYSTSSPVTAHLVAGLLKRWTGLPWVAEFRDPWLGNALAAELPWFHRRLQVKLERWIVGSADRVVGLSPGITNLYRTRYPNAPEMVTITSGYDRSEAPEGRKRRRDDGQFRIVYTGTLDRPPELEIFLQGLDALVARRPDLEGCLEVSFYGSVADSCRVIVDRYLAGRLRRVVRLLGFVPRRDALAALASADAALILLGTGPGMGLFIGGKLFDYIGQGVQILAMLPRGDSRDILEALEWGVVCDPDPADVGRAIEHLMNLPPPGRPADPAGIYDRAVLAGQLARSLDEVARSRPRTEGVDQ